ncbi:hypothetical protein Ptr902_03773 [Pyrenophora tritici-repentis]|nr:hypothetical protein L13192_12600 [Pyrenophora tritici-repentis]KAI1667248.1 hypothetical protein L13192_07957 [Pyrenophora tritici-repentis]KAI2475341.1 hypothetical protein Ptr902_13264 [Pyrenophora tritici-repentis]KAI2475465.1 hypothetical protein Ptr902_13151 [Pyrenophora tritici-repentis]KAI2484833.1 hypothetical protein Ptr902_03773 [Pyrenophora tritici-repentis]
MNPIYLLLAFVSLSFAGVILDMSLTGIDITQPNSTRNSKISARAFPNTRRNLGQELCFEDLKTTAGRTSRDRRILFKTSLISATCDNDIDYNARCQTIIPANHGILTHEGKCFFDEVCSQIAYKNFAGHDTSEVACTEKDRTKHEVEWSTDDSDIDVTHCGPGLTGIKEENKLTVSIQFYGGSNAGGRNWVSQAWLQSNKRSKKILSTGGVNGLYWEGALHPGESIQGCFVREALKDATKAIMDWVDG